MAQRPRLSTEACDQAEQALDTWLAAWADGRIDGEEANRITVILANTVAVTSEVDEGIAEAVAVVRGGRDSEWARRLRTERRLRNERAATAA